MVFNKLTLGIRWYPRNPKMHDVSLNERKFFEIPLLGTDSEKYKELKEFIEENNEGYFDLSSIPMAILPYIDHAIPATLSNILGVREELHEGYLTFLEDNIIWVYDGIMEKPTILLEFYVDLLINAIVHDPSFHIMKQPSINSGYQWCKNGEQLEAKLEQLEANLEPNFTITVLEHNLFSEMVLLHTHPVW